MTSIVHSHIAAALLVFWSIIVFAADETPYHRIDVAHRLVVTAHNSILLKVEDTHDPLRSKLLREFSREKLRRMVVEILKSYIGYDDALALAEFLESDEGKKLVLSVYGEYDAKTITSDEWNRIEQFMATEAGAAYDRFATAGIQEFHRQIRARTEDVMSNE